MTIESRTSEIDIVKPGGFKPNAPLFLFQNTGNTYVFINGRVLVPGESWGIDNSVGLQMGLAFGKDIMVKETTTYQIRFGTVNIDPGGFYGAVITPKCTLIRTEFVLIK